MNKLQLRPQEIPFDDPDSCCMFQPSSEKPLMATRGAIETFTLETVTDCWKILNSLAMEKSGIDYLQIFDSEDDGRLWFIEDNDGGAITALLPDEY